MAEVGYDPDEEELDGLTTEEEAALSGASTARTPDELRGEIAKLGELIAQAEATRRMGPERKLVELQRAIRSQTVADRDEKILIFTEHRDTLVYLSERLREQGYRVCVIHGGMKLADRIAAEKEFRGAAQFMVATEAAGEGINLQFCKVMINWDLPWNPNRLEQRMGRIHRYGQESEVNVINLVAAETRGGAGDGAAAGEARTDAGGRSARTTCTTSSRTSSRTGRCASKRSSTTPSPSGVRGRRFSRTWTSSRAPRRSRASARGWATRSPPGTST